MAGNISGFGSVTGQTKVTTSGTYQERLEQCKELNSTLWNYKYSMDAEVYNNNQSICDLTGQIRTYESMASTLPEGSDLRVKYENKIKDLQTQIDQKENDIKELKEMLTTCNERLEELRVETRVVESQLGIPDTTYGKQEPDFKSVRYKEEVLGETKHMIAKNGDHWYVDDPKSDSKVDAKSFFDGLKDFFGDFHINASDSWDAWNKTEGYTKKTR